MLVKGAEFTGQIIQIGAQPVRAVFVERVQHRGVKLQQPQHECALGFVFNKRCYATNACPIYTSLAENAADSSMRILQIRRRVAIKREHALPIKHVILNPIRRQVGVFNRAYAHLLGNRIVLSI